jgi:glucose-6-phosphate 1-epimerase
MMNIEQLNIDHRIDDQIKFVEGTEGFPFIKVSNDSASAVISVYAGQVLSFQPANEAHNLMFLSQAAYYAPGKGIKGGTPVCWPWFGPDPEGKGRPAHGFVRTRFWEVMGTEAISNEESKVTLGLADSPETRAIWPYPFMLLMEITVGKSLQLELITRNAGSQPFSITQALHTYFKVGHISEIAVLGLENTEYIDKTDNAAHKLQTGTVTIDREVDRIYRNVSHELIIDDAALDRRIRIASRGSRTAVVWNPWEKISAEMGDLEDDDYQHFVCVETANADLDVAEVAPDGEVRLGASYRIERDVPGELKALRTEG